MADVFISYAKEDKKRAAELASVLESQGWSVWWDRQIPLGQSFDEVIEEALTGARCVIVLWSAKSIASRWVRAEASAAAERSILVPLLIEDVSIPLEFRRMQAAKLVGSGGDVDHAELSKLIDSVRHLVASDPGEGVFAEPKSTAPRRKVLQFLRTWAVVTVLVGLAAAAGLTYMLLHRDSNSSSSHAVQGQSPPSPQVPANPSGSVSQGAVSGSGNPTTVPTKGRLNLLSPRNGGHLLAAPNETWTATNDDSEDLQQLNYSIGGEGVYAFKDEQAATFDTFAMLILNNEKANIKEFELLAGNESPQGYFESIGKFETQNVRLFPSAWQEFKFRPVRAKYFKVRLISTYGFPQPQAWEWQLFGTY